MNLKFFDYIFVADRIWIPSIENVAPHSKTIKIVCGGGFYPDLFYPVPDEQLLDNEHLKCDIAFTGESYHLRAEGGYRAGILEQLTHHDLKIWGDSGWKMRFPYHNGLEKTYQGERLSYDDLRKLYRTATIIINMPAPQILTGFQPRVFEIAACKGFQIVDWREELDELFTGDELVTFKNIPELLSKVEYFIKNPEKRQPYIDNMYHKVWGQYTWEKRAKEMIGHITAYN